MAKSKRDTAADRSKDSASQQGSDEEAAKHASADDKKPNPPRTTLGRWFTAPKFGSSGSGGAELEPGPERD